MKHFFNRLIGFSVDKPFEQILYNGICFYSIIGVLCLTVFNYVLQMYISFLITLIIAIFLGILFYWARFRKKYYYFFLYVFSLLLSVIGYFMSLGIFGTSPYFLLLILVLALSYNPVKLHVRIIIFHLTILILIFLIQFFFPQLFLNPFKSQSILHFSLIITLIICVLMCSVSIYFLRNSYDYVLKKNQQQKELLEKTTQQKSMFFINLSHEIKTPLTLVENYLEKYIERKGEDEELLIMRQNIHKMRRDILDYLNFENIERGKMSFENIEIFSLDKFLEEKIKLFIYYAKNAGVELNYNIDSAIYIKTNARGMDQVLNNLLENAVKYTPKQGKINITLKADKLNAKLVVQNTGNTIPQDQISHLFEPFYQLSREKSNAQGIGMGLYTVKKIVDNAGGQIEATSSKELGIAFSVTLPLCAEEQTTIQPINNISDVNKDAIMPKAVDSIYLTNRSSLLLVEDHNDLLRYLADVLCETYNIFVAENGLVALKKLENIPVPDLIISDIMMDTMDGYELFKKTITDKRLAHIPFIFLTAKDEPEVKRTSFDMGVLDFITKPFSINELKLKIKAIIEHKARISEAAILDLKKQYSDSHSLQIKQKRVDLFNLNASRYNLTSREKEVVDLIKQGLKYEKIGEKLHISEHTVNRHVQNIYIKTASSSKIDLLEKMFLLEG